MKPRSPYLQTSDLVPSSTYLQVGLLLGGFTGGLLGFAGGLLLALIIR